MSREIVISRMYSGAYLRLNLGHEIINMFKADDGKHYIYLNDLGTFGKEHFDAEGNLTIESVLLTHTIEGMNVVEVLGVAIGLHALYNPTLSTEENAQIQLDLKKSVAYGGVPASKVFAGYKAQDVFFTFEADEVRRVAEGKHIYIKMADKDGQTPRELQVYEDDVLVHLEDVKMGQGLKTYVSAESADFAQIEALVQDAANWENTIATVAESPVPEDMSLLTICGRENDEVAYSNALAFFFKKYPSLLGELLNSMASIKSTFYEFVVEREVGHTDLLCYNSTNLIVIENKIKSDINGIEKDENGVIVKTQLDDYVEFSKKFRDEYCPKALIPRYYLLVPDYSNIRHYHMDHFNPYTPDSILVGKFSVLYYSTLYKFLTKKIKKAPFSKDVAFKEFVKSIEPHTHLTDDSLYRDMLRRFHERIEAVNKGL